ncbi:MAG: DUF4097 domain-containing protein [Gemmatimonadetes bacterium]|uniref:DUF4097 domain-containing protein n=1 Tax=Candidatus Kutchimonas denitrificans TaxID=3056748 RepID=A0AAE5CBC8_9BACT|nr:DUF4097 domain-containing protein [Gemmatimonadota bacterium]NIR75677.1 DUF4097 domain-containing protein [Candidatus Kutchimonas denitrificans]NIS00289.1 DUF4097 domain-containing protein [Gemmatimonadota bacterium]NIT65948.1 DUF4097 domain-containing protein [Gemmatimonadota bacterium]NIU53645.1 DUF4097 family beta strand repeat protein [Gemmatimonadota bacterium]
MHLRVPMLTLLLAAMACATAAAPSATIAQQGRVVQDRDWCDNDWNDDDNERHCEVREFTLSPRDLIAVNASPNGGIEVEGWDRNEVLVRAKVSARGRSESDAREIAGEVEIETGGRWIEADGPRTRRHESWWVSYRVFVPTNTNLDLKSTNGSIRISDVAGRIDFRTTNGGVRLARLQGDVNGRTTNGGLRVELAGDRWEGRGLDVRTTNGGVKLYVPDGYNCRLETGTVNGSFRIDFPVTVQGRLDRRHFNVELGDGGPTIRAVTTNGGVVVERA